jgi:hypothetical protein
MILTTSRSTITDTPTSNQTATLTPASSSTLLPPDEATVHAEVAIDLATHKYSMFTEVPAPLEARNAKCKDGFIMEQDVEVLRNSSDEWTLFTCSPVPANKNDLWTPGAVNYGTRYTHIAKSLFSDDK